MGIIIFALLTNFLYFCCGSLVISEKKSDFHSQFNIYFIGVIIISFISLVLNFFTPLITLINWWSGYEEATNKATKWNHEGKIVWLDWKQYSE